MVQWLPLALVTAVAFGLYTVFIKVASNRIDQVLGAVVLQLVAAALGGCFALVLKFTGRTLAVSGSGLVYAGLAGVAVGAAEILTFYVFARGAPASLGTPIIMGGSVLVAGVVGVLLLGEVLRWPQAAGILLIAVGIGLLSSGQAH